jgi:DUF438 domain-containing protein
MSKFINNREFRKDTIKNIIMQLHEGKSVDEVKKQFEDVFNGVAAAEISEVESALVQEGIPVEEIQKLCDVHAAVFKGSIEEIHDQETKLENIPGHPLNTLIKENKEIQKMVDELTSLNFESSDNFGKVKEKINELLKISIHYRKKENLIFPYMEKYGMTTPPKVMWGVDDEIYAEIKSIKETIEKGSYDDKEVAERIKEVTQKIEEMIFKEENIMLPMLVDELTQDEWKAIADGSHEFGFLIANVQEWKPQPGNIALQKEEKTTGKGDGIIKLPTGSFTIEELECMLNTLPFDITFVGKDDAVKYFSQSAERIFPRTNAVIGRNVSNCHPPASVHIVEKIVEDFKAGEKDHEDFWIRMKGLYVYIRYFAVRDKNGEYLGVLEVTQNIKPIKELEGEKRLVSE